MCLFSHVIQDNRQLGKLFSINISVVQFNQKNRENGRSYVCCFKVRTRSESFFLCIFTYTNTHTHSSCERNKWLSKNLHVISFWHSEFHECIYGDTQCQSFHKGLFKKHVNSSWENSCQNFSFGKHQHQSLHSECVCVCVSVGCLHIYPTQQHCMCKDVVMCVKPYTPIVLYLWIIIINMKQKKNTRDDNQVFPSVFV